MSQTQPIHRAPIYKPGAQIRDTQQLSQEASALLGAMDKIRHSENENEELLRLALDDTAVLEIAREIGHSQGEQLDENKLREALEEVRARRYVFEEPKLGMAGTLAQAWVTRSQWGPKWRMRGLVLAMASGLSVAAVYGVQNYQESQFIGEIELTVVSEQQISEGLKEELGKINLEVDTPVFISSRLAQARQHIVQGMTLLGQLPVAPEGKAREKLYEEDKAQAQAMLAGRQQKIKAAITSYSSAKTLIQEAERLKVAYQERTIFEQPIPSNLVGLRDRLRLEFQTAAQDGDINAMQETTRLLHDALAVIQLRQALEQQASTLSGKSRQEVMRRLDEATLVAVNGDADRAKALMNDIIQMLELTSKSYTLRIVSEPNESTGVWRYYGNDRSAKNYYIVVDAIGADGNPIELPITSVEDKNVVYTSRFAVRVPEHVYNEVGEDKRDGIVDNDIMGQKAVGDLEPTYAFPVSGGAITRW